MGDKPSLLKHLLSGAGIGGSLGTFGTAVSLGPKLYGGENAFGPAFSNEKMTFKQLLERIDPKDSSYTIKKMLKGLGIGAVAGAGVGALAYLHAKNKKLEQEKMNKQASFQMFLRKTAGEEMMPPMEQEGMSMPQEGQEEMDPRYLAYLQQLMAQQQQQGGEIPEEQFPDQGQPIEEDIYDPEKMGSYDPVRLQRIGHGKSKAPRATSALKTQAPLPKKGSNDPGF